MRPSGKPARFPDIPGYRLEGVLGRGSTGVVYRAVQLAVDRPVAVKVLHAELTGRGRAIRRLQREARTTAKLAHPNIVGAIDMGEAGGRWWYAMELVEGLSLAERLKRDGRLSEREALRVFIPLCDALEHAWEAGVVHRDIKPANVLLEKNRRARLVDLGLAFAEDDPNLTSQGGTLGTPHYISPEQARDPQSADTRSDIWSMGATMYHAVCGRPPFAGESVAEILSGVLYGRIPDPGELEPKLSKGFRLVLRKCLSRDPARRYANPSELLEDLERLRERRTVTVQKSALDPVRRSYDPRKRAAWVAGVVVLVAGAALALSRPWSSSDEGPDPSGAPVAFAPLEDVVDRMRRGELGYGAAVVALDDMRLEVPGFATERWSLARKDALRRYDEAVAEARRMFLAQLSELVVERRDWRSALGLIDDGVLPPLEADLEPSATQMEELRERLGLEAKRREVVAGLERALDALTAQLAEHYERVVEPRAESLRARGAWRSGWEELGRDVDELLAEARLPTAAFPPERARERLAEFRTRFVEPRLAAWEERWRATDAELAAYLRDEASELEASLEARALPGSAREALIAAFERRTRESGPAEDEFLTDVSDLARSELERLALELDELEARLAAADSAGLYAEEVRAQEPLWRRREYAAIRDRWLGVLERDAAAVRPRIELILEECALLVGLLERAVLGLEGIARRGERVSLLVGSIRIEGRIQLGRGPLERGFLLEDDTGTTTHLLLAGEAEPGMHLLAGEELERIAGLDEGVPLERLTLALFRAREGDFAGAARLLPLRTPSRPDLAGLVVDLDRRVERERTRRADREGEREREARQLYHLVRRADTHADAGRTLQRIEELLESYGDLPFVASKAAELREQQRSLAAPRGPLDEDDFREAFGAGEVRLSRNPDVVEMVFEFGPTARHGWRPGDWLPVADGWGAPGARSRADLGIATKWPRLLLGELLDLDEAMELELVFRQPQDSGDPRLLVVSFAGVHIVLGGSRGLGEPAHWLVGSGGQGEMLELVDAVLAGEKGNEFAGLERGKTHTIRITLEQGRGKGTVVLDGERLGDAAARRPEGPGTASIAVRSLEVVHLLRARLTARFE